MKIRNLFASALVLTFALSVAGCGGGGGSTARAVKSFSKGVITAKGSVTVNGVKYDSSTSKVRFENLSGANADNSKLKVGMVVELKGTVNDDGYSGSAVNIEFTDNLQGKIDSVDTVAKTLTVFGQTVKVDDQTNFYGGTSGLTGPTPLRAGDVVEVSGFPDSAGVIRATFIEKKNGLTEFEIKGTVSNYTQGGTTFTLTPPNSSQPLTVTLGAGVQPPPGFDNKVYVEVRTSGSGLAFIATKVELEQELSADEKDKVELEGLVTSVDTVKKTFVLNGVTIDASAMTMPTVGQRVEVEGLLLNGVLVPVKQVQVEQESDTKVEADVEAISGNSVTLLGMTGIVTPTTEFKDDQNDNSAHGITFGLANLKPGDHVEVETAKNPSDPKTVLIIRLVRKDPSTQIVVQKYVDTIPTSVPGTFMLGNVIIDINATPANNIKDLNNNPTTIDAFIKALRVGKTLVRAVGVGTNFTSATKTLKADEADIQAQLT